MFTLEKDHILADSELTLSLREGTEDPLFVSYSWTVTNVGRDRFHGTIRLRADLPSAFTEPWFMLPGFFYGENVGPHTLRHTTAMHLLQSGNDLSVIKDWLGHADMNTTHEYAAIDMKMKQRALDSCQAPAVKKGGKGRPRWLKPGILKWLDDLSEGAEIM